MGFSILGVLMGTELSPWWRRAWIMTAENKKIPKTVKVNLLIPPAFTPKVCAPIPPKASPSPPPLGSCNRITTTRRKAVRKKASHKTVLMTTSNIVGSFLDPELSPM